MGPTDGTLDLAAQNYTDLGFWKPVTGTELLPNGFNIDQSPSSTIARASSSSTTSAAETLAYVKNATVTTRRRDRQPRPSRP